jgi:hypothetical protein
MTALAQGSAGLALVMGFALLVTGQVTAAAVLLAVQSGAVAVTAVVLHRPLMAIPPLLLAAVIWLMRHETPDPRTTPTGGAKLGVTVGAVLAILCQSLGSLALPSAIVLLSILLAATRSHKSMQMVALVAIQNGLALAGSLIAPPPMLPAALLFPLACLVLPLPLAAWLLIPTLPAREALHRAASWTAAWLGWLDLSLALAICAATLIVPLDPLASIFAPLLALDGVLRSWVRRNRPALPVPRRGFALAQTGFTVLAVCAPNLTIAWLAVLAAMATALLPTLSRRWGGAILAFLAAGLALFGMLLLPATPPVLGWFSLLAGFATIAAVVPDLAVVFVILILRLANHAPWPPAIETLGIGIAVLALLACAILLTNPVRSHRTTLLVLCQASIAALTICTGQAEGRFAALVLLILLILSRAAARIIGGPAVRIIGEPAVGIIAGPAVGIIGGPAARIINGPAATLAMAGLGGVPPFGVFPGLVLVALTLSAHDPWLLLPVGAALVPIVLASLPAHLPDFSPRPAIPSIAWLPLVLAIMAGYFAPEGLVHWWRILTAGRT